MSKLSPVDVNSLPADVLTSIFRYFPFRPLMLVLSLVCKRWREIAPLGVHEIRPPSLWNHLNSNPKLLMSFKSLTSRYIRDEWAAPCADEFLRLRITSLTALSSGPSPAVPLSLDHPSVGSITSLYVAKPHWDLSTQITCVASSLRELHLSIAALDVPGILLPVLQVLDITCGPRAEIDTFLCTHISRLTSLSITTKSESLGPSVYACSSTTLKSLSLLLRVSSFDNQTIPLFINRCTNVTSLTLGTLIHLKNLCRSVDLLARASCTVNDDSRALPLDLTLSYVDHDAIGIEGGILRRLDLNMELIRSKDFKPIMRLCTNLMHLSLSTVELEWEAAKDQYTCFTDLSSWHLPFLHRLSFPYHPNCTAAQRIDLLRILLLTWPSLCYADLEIFVNDEISESEVDVIDSILQKAEQCSLRELNLGSIGLQPFLALQPLIRKCKWLLISDLL